MSKQLFGGSWTIKKLTCLRKYLPAYTTIISKHFNDYFYIDAFAGTGWFVLKQNEEVEICDSIQLSLFPDFSTKATELSSEKLYKPLDGSARIALKTEPTFTRYIFIEQNKKRFKELQKLQQEFPEKHITFENSDANTYLTYLCNNFNWLEDNVRAVLFLDPFGMNVSWQTIELIASTKAIDLWYLFPIGIALNRLLKKNGKISKQNQLVINSILGNTEWYNVFYEQCTYPNLFNNKTINKVANFSSIAKYVNGRLKSIFPGVAENPKMLFNKRGNPLHLLCFASANPKGSVTAIKIAQDILKRD